MGKSFPGILSSYNPSKVLLHYDNAYYMFLIRVPCEGCFLLFCISSKGRVVVDEELICVLFLQVNLCLQNILKAMQVKLFSDMFLNLDWFSVLNVL